MKRTALLLVALFFLSNPAFSGAQEEEAIESTCISCHELLEDNLLEPVKLFKNDIHNAKGVSCHDCHGGDPTSEDPDEAMDPANGFSGVPDELAIPRFCGRCHSDADYMSKYKPALAVDQEKKYRTSIHGKLNSAGDRSAAHCVSCHSVHDVRRADDPLSTVYAVNVPLTCSKCHSDPAYMKDYDIPTDQFFKFSRSVHGIALMEDKDMAAPACNDCHGNHGAIPPGVTSIAFVCGNCHVNNMDLFNSSPMKKAFTDLHLPGCETCHGNHDILKPSDAIVGVGARSVCLNCHSEKTRPRGYRVAIKIKEHLVRLTEKKAEVDSIVSLAEQKGMEVLEAKYRLKDVRQALIEARTMVHSFDPAKVKEKVEVGVEAAEEALRIGSKSVEDYYFRRKWWGVSTLVISFLAFALFLKIKEVDRRASF